MKSEKITSLFMVFLVLGASFVTLCPASQNHNSDVHFIAEVCETHECNRAAGSPSSAQEEKRQCGDESIAEEFRIVHQNRITLSPPLPVNVQNDLFRPEFRSITPATAAYLPALPPVRTVVLRI